MSTLTHADRNRWQVLLIAALVGMAPVLMVIIPWDFGPVMTPYRALLRGLSLTVTLIEAVIVIFTMSRGISIFRAFGDLPRLSKIGLTLLMFVMAVGAISAHTPALSAIGLLKILMHALFFLVMRAELQSWNKDQLQTIWPAIGAGLIIYWIVWLINIWIYNPQGEEWVYLLPGVTNVRSLGFFAVAGFFASFAIMGAQSTGRSSYLSFSFAAAIAISALVMVFWTGSRGGLLAILVGLFFLAVFAGSSRSRLLWFSLLSFLIATGISINLPSVNPSYGIERIISSSAPTSMESDVSSGRVGIWRQTAQKITKKPLFGWGVEQFAVAGPERSLGLKQPHNMFLQLLFSTGVLGAIAVLLIVLPVMSKINFDISKPEKLAAWGYLIGTLTFGLYDAAFYYTYPVMIFLLAGILVLQASKPEFATDT